MQKTLSRKKGFAVLLTLMLTLPIMSIAFITPAYAASGTIRIFPTVFTKGTTTTVVVNGGVFGSGATVEFYISTDTEFVATGAGADTLIATKILPAGQTSFSNTVVDFALSSITTTQQYYVAATDDDGATWTAYVNVTVTAASLTLALDFSSGSPGTTIFFSGTGYTANGQVQILMGAPQSPPGTLLKTVTADIYGMISGSFTVPDLPSGNYKVYSVDMSSGLTNGAGVTFTVTSAITVEPFVMSKNPGNVLTVKGRGFPAGLTITANSITIGGQGTSHPAVTVASDGTFTVSVTTLATYDAGWKEVAVGSVTSYVLVSIPGYTDPTITFWGGSTFTTNNVGDSVTVYVYNYPAQASFEVSINNIVLGTNATNGLGAGMLSFTVPEVPGTASGRPYLVDAAVTAQGIVAKPPKATLNVQSKAVISPTVIRNGETITITGKGFPAEATLTITTTSALTLSPSAATTDGKGSFSVNVKVTKIESVDSYTVSVGGVATTPSSFIGIPGPATLTLTPQHGLVGSTIGVSGSNFIPGGTYEILFDGASLSPKVTFTVGTTGSVPSGTQFVVPSKPMGVYKVSVVLLGTTQEAASKNFVVSNPSPAVRYLKLSKTTVSPGDQVEFYYYGWASTDSVTTSLSGYGTIVSAWTSPSGGYVASVTIPDLPKGTYLIYTTPASDNAKVLLTVVPKITSISATSGLIGDSISITAKGLARNTAYGVKFGDKYLGLIGYSDDYGTVSGSFTVPVVLPGTYTVSLVSTADPTAAIVSTTFTVTEPSGLVVTPDPSAFPGQLVTFVWSGVGTGLIEPVYVTVLLNDQAYTTFPARYDSTASGTLYGSFQMPNAPAGTIWALKFTYSDSRQVLITTMATGGTDISTTSSLTGTAEDAPTPTVSGTITLTFPSATGIYTVTGSISATGTGAVTLTSVSFTDASGTFDTLVSSNIVFHVATFSSPSGGAAGTFKGYITGTLTVKSSATGAQASIALAAGSSSSPLGTDSNWPNAGGTVSDVTASTGTWNFFGQTYKDSPQQPLSPIGPVALKLVEGSGALIMSISDADVTRIANAVNATVYGPIATVVTQTGETVRVALSDLINGKISDVLTAITNVNGTLYAQIVTKYGEMMLKLDAVNATTTGLITTAKGEVLAKIDTALGTVTSKLDAINAKLVDINGTVATIDSNVGAIKTDVAVIKPKIVSVEGDVATIKSDVGSIKVDVSAIKPVVTDIKDGVATIRTTVGDISGKVISIDGNVAKVMTDVGVVKADASTIKTGVDEAKTDIKDLEGAVSGVTMAVWVAVILSLIAAIAAIYSVVTIHRKIAG